MVGPDIVSPRRQKILDVFSVIDMAVTAIDVINLPEGAISTPLPYLLSEYLSRLAMTRSYRYTTLQLRFAAYHRLPLPFPEGLVRLRARR